MKRLLIVTLAIALGLVGSWTAAADSADVPIPEPTAVAATDLVDVEADVADSESPDLVDQESVDPSAGLKDGNYGLPSPESELRQNNGCAISSCSHPIMCPNIINLPRASCVNGCCVYY